MPCVAARQVQLLSAFLSLRLSFGAFGRIDRKQYLRVASVDSLFNFSHFSGAILISASWMLSNLGRVSSFRPSEIGVSAAKNRFFLGKRCAYTSVMINYLNSDSWITQIHLPMMMMTITEEYPPACCSVRRAFHVRSRWWKSFSQFA